MLFKDYYKILGLESSRVSKEDIKFAYRTAAKKYHPDLHIGDKLAEEKIKDINEAYKILSNSATKRKYDRTWNANIGYGEKVFNKKEKSTSILKNMFFVITDKQEHKEEEKKPIRGEDVETQIKINIYEAFYGLEKKISLKTIEGKIRNFTVTIPAGIIDGEKIRLIGQGKKGQNGGKNGDLFIKIKIEKNKDFKLDGYDIITNLLLTPWEAAMGTRVSIKTIEDETKIYIPQGTQSGEKLKIPGKGYKDSKGNRGDLIAEVKILVPRNLTEEEKILFKKLNKISKFNPRNE